MPLFLKRFFATATVVPAAKGKDASSKARQQAGLDRPPDTSGDPASTRETKMEALLDRIREATDTLLTALASEEAARAAIPFAYSQDRVSADQIAKLRAESQRAQGNYHEAVERYRQFVGSLELPLQPGAAQRGLDVMTLAPMLGNYSLTVPSLSGRCSLV